MKNKYLKKLFFSSVFLAFSFGANAQNQNEVAKIRSKSDLNKLQTLRENLSKKATSEKAKAMAMAKQKGWKTRIETENGSLLELERVVDNKPIYYTTYNVDAAESTRTDHLHSGGSLGLNLMGQNMTAHVWDGGLARSSHQEYDGAGGTNRFSVGDGSSTLNFHAAHVTGTIIASGVVADAKGMAPHAKAIGHDWNSDTAEAAAAAANGMLISNHSYGYATRDQFGNVQLPDYFFGGYVDTSREWDEIAFNAPYYLMVVAAGNDGNDNTASPNPTGGSGFDKLTGHSTSKNNLVVANANDANISNAGDLNSVTINSSSSEGPTDDFRIKPDIAGNGTGVYSTYEGSNTEYASITGTSMASPNVAGSLLLLQQHYQNENGSFMRSATLKGLALHTADDAGASGPDAVFGWGLLNVKRAAEAISDNGEFSKIEELTLSQGQTYTTTVESDGTNPLFASISWTDRPGVAVTSVSSASVLVNDLDVRLFKDNEEFFPYELTGATSSTARDNNVDPYERVDIGNASGTYTIVVTHKGSLTGGSQNFSLVVTGISEDGGTPDDPDTPDTTAPTAPTNLTASNVTETTATINWSASNDNVGVVAYNVYNATQLLGQVTGTSASITGLVTDTTYSYSVTALDAAGNESSAGSVTFTTGSSGGGGGNLTYCDSEGQDSSFEWIDYVAFGGFENTTGNDGGYADYTGISAVMSPGSTDTLLISAGFASTSYTEFWKIWIDYDQNGSFDDDEVIAAGSSGSANILSVDVTIPNSAVLGTTVMRVSMKYNSEQTACETFEYGEVEDYTINITNSNRIASNSLLASSSTSAKEVSTSASVLGFEEAFEFKAYPNPSTSFINVNIQNAKEIDFEIRNMSGQLVAKNVTNNGVIDVNSIPTGVYFLNASDGQKTYNTKLIITK